MNNWNNNKNIVRPSSNNQGFIHPLSLQLPHFHSSNLKESETTITFQNEYIKINLHSSTSKSSNSPLKLMSYGYVNPNSGFVDYFGGWEFMNSSEWEEISKGNFQLKNQ